MSERVTPAKAGAANRSRDRKSGQERKLVQSRATTPWPGGQGVGNLEAWARAYYERGLAMFNYEKEVFEPITRFELTSHMYPRSHPF